MDILQKTKLKMLTHPELLFYAMLTMQLDCEMSRDVPTAATNGKWIKFNPDFVEGMSPEEFLGLFVHELLHVALLHMFRIGNRDPRIWNAANDYVINLQIIDQMKLKLPKDGLYDTSYEGMSSEEVYDLLMEEQDSESTQNSIGQDLVEPDTGDTADGGDAAKEAAMAVLQQEVEAKLVNAAMATAAQNPGSIPDAVKLFLDKRVKPIVPWYKALHRYLQPLVAGRYSLARPNKRFLPAYMPKLAKSPKKLEITVAWDMSGSVSDADSCRYISETIGITKQLKAKLTVVQFDTRIQHVNVLKTLSDFKKLDYSGRGGTDVNCVMGYVHENPTRALVIFTDGYFDMPRKPACPVIWIIVNNSEFTAPYGKVIHVRSE